MVRKIKPVEPLPKKNGRPPTTPESLGPNWQQRMRDVAQEGGSDVEAMCTIGVGKSAWASLLRDFQEFRDVVDECHLLCQVWWEREGKKMTKGSSKGNGKVWEVNMQNRFGWNSKTQISGDQDNPLKVSSESVLKVTPAEASQAYIDLIQGKKK